MNNTTKMRLVSRMPHCYSFDYEYPRLILRGKWLENCGIPADAEVSLFNPSVGTMVIVRYLKGDDDLSLGKLVKNITVASTDGEYGYMELRGYWFLRCGFNAGDQVEISCPQKRLVVVRVTRTYKELERERSKLVETGRSEWMMFTSLLAAS